MIRQDGRETRVKSELKLLNTDLIPVNLQPQMGSTIFIHLILGSRKRKWQIRTSGRGYERQSLIRLYPQTNETFYPPGNPRELPPELELTLPASLHAQSRQL